MKKALSILFFLILLAGCSKEPAPEERFSEYVKLWNEQNFSEMYEFLSNTAKESVSKDAFVERYHKIYQDLGINELDVQFKVPENAEEAESETIFPFDAKMGSIAGDIEFTHEARMVKEKQGDEENWYLDWDTTYIFPELGSGDKVSIKTVPALRGSILDRNGNGLAVNGTALQIGVVPGKLGEGSEKENRIKQLSELLHMSEEQINNALNAGWVKPDLFVPLKKIPKTDVELQEKLFAVGGVTSQEVGARVYPYGEDLSHLIGFVAPVTAEDLEKLADKGYTSTDYLGKRGLEQVFEEKLRGQNGVRILIIKENGEEKVLAEKPVQDGEDVQLTIDTVLQQQIYDQMKGTAGMASAIHPKTGETLALVSSPGFDPNAETLGMSAQQRQALQDDPLNPYLNRFKLNYAPGSVIKPITAAVGLNSGGLSLDTSYDIKAKQWQKDGSWGKYKVTRVSDVKGKIDLEKALIYSDNIYFARAALEIGKDSFASGLKKLGFEQLEYAYPLENSQIGELGNDIQLADSGYGQAQVEMNVLHLSAAYTMFMNGGSMIKPVLLAEEEKGQILAESFISAEEASALEGMMRKVVSSPEGTGYSARIEGYPLAGKTGTAEIKSEQGTKGRELGWFVAYNPDSPDVLISMMVEDVQDKNGSREAISRVKGSFEAYIKE